MVCSSIIDCCIGVGVNTLPLVKHNARKLLGWNEHVKHEREQSLFRHWVWSEMGKPYNGVIYEIMKRTRHSYHYAVRRLKKDKIKIHKERLAENLSDNTTF